jgi:hypothetical protein
MAALMAVRTPPSASGATFEIRDSKLTKGSSPLQWAIKVCVKAGSL